MSNAQKRVTKPSSTQLPQHIPRLLRLPPQPSALGQASCSRDVSAAIQEVLALPLALGFGTGAGPGVAGHEHWPLRAASQSLYLSCDPQRRGRGLLQAAIDKAETQIYVIPKVVWFCVRGPKGGGWGVQKITGSETHTLSTICVEQGQGRLWRKVAGQLGCSELKHGRDRCGYGWEWCGAQGAPPQCCLHSLRGQGVCVRPNPRVSLAMETRKRTTGRMAL